MKDLDEEKAGPVGRGPRSGGFPKVYAHGGGGFQLRFDSRVVATFADIKDAVMAKRAYDLAGGVAPHPDDAAMKKEDIAFAKSIPVQVRNYMAKLRCWDDWCNWQNYVSGTSQHEVAVLQMQEGGGVESGEEA